MLTVRAIAFWTADDYYYEAGNQMDASKIDHPPESVVMRFIFGL